MRQFRTLNWALDPFKRCILHVPNSIRELNVCEMRRLNQLNFTINTTFAEFATKSVEDSTWVRHLIWT